MGFLRIEISYYCGVIYGYRKRNTMSFESFPSNKPQSVAGWENVILAWVKGPHSFQYGTWSFLWSRQSGTVLSIFFNFKHKSPHHFIILPVFYFPRRDWGWGGGGCHFFIRVKRGECQKLYVGSVKTNLPLWKISFSPVLLPRLQYTFNECSLSTSLIAEGRSRHEARQGKRLVWISNKTEFSKNAKTTIGPFIRGKIRRELYHLYEHVLSKTRTARINGSRLISVLDSFSCECRL